MKPKKKIEDITQTLQSEKEKAVAMLLSLDLSSSISIKQIIREKERQMPRVVRDLDFETAAILRDEIKLLKDKEK